MVVESTKNAGIINMLVNHDLFTNKMCISGKCQGHLIYSAYSDSMIRQKCGTVIDREWLEDISNRPIKEIEIFEGEFEMTDKEKLEYVLKFIKTIAMVDIDEKILLNSKYFYKNHDEKILAYIRLQAREVLEKLK